MKIISYKLGPTNIDEWDFDEAYFDRVNLIVGDSGTGKTRFMNTIVNFTKQLISEKAVFSGDWRLRFEIDQVIYKYALVVKESESNPGEKYVENEELINETNDHILVSRNSNGFYWKGGVLPKLGNDMTSIYLLREEAEVKPIFQSFRKIIARRFFQDALSENFGFKAMVAEKQNKVIDNKDISALLSDTIDFHNRMAMLRLMDLKTYEQVIGLYKQAFPYITDVQILPINNAIRNLGIQIPSVVFCIKEKNVNSWIPVNDISSGMQKIFLLILDIFIIKEGGVLLIDEYENSLGMNAINFLPDLLYTISDKCQFIITSHHPYIINNIDIENWLVFHRDGLKISIKSGKDLKEKYGKSKQQQFIQLINDPFYTGGIE